VELFLNRVLGLDWSEVDAEAEALEHAISPRLEQAIAAHLGEPLEDPHGHLIPTREGMLTQRELQRLCDFRAGQRVVIREAQDDHPGRLRRWQELGLVPGATVEIVHFEPLDNLFEVRVGKELVRLGPEALAGLRGEPAGTE
jgi:DtxR family Mn-dependent transcriptional regulator